MIAFYLLKPDLLQNNDALNFYKEFLFEEKIKLILEKNTNWIELSKILYEPHNIRNIDELRLIRKHMLTSIKGYQMLYDDICRIDIFYTDLNKLDKLYRFKKELRKKYVYLSDKYYIKFSEKLPLDLELKNIDIENINCHIIRKKYDEDFYNSDYSMAFFNKIHFPDPNINDINNDLDIVCKHLLKRRL